MTAPPPPERPDDDPPGRPEDEALPAGQVDGPAGSWRLTARDGPAIEAALQLDGPLSREAALLLLNRGQELIDTGDFQDAARHYQRVIGYDDAAVTAAGLLGLGTALHRLNRDEDALQVWEQVTQLPETPSTYPAWRHVAGGRVRAGDNRGALAAYREADRRAPPEDKPEIASRLGWLAKETGDTRAAGRYFARARGADALSLSYVVVGMTVVVSLLADGGISPEGDFLRSQLALDKVAVAAGEWWRLLTVALVHAEVRQMPLHLLFNMYALWIAGPLVERMYGRVAFLAFYVVFAVAGSIATFAFGEARFGVGASGAIFGVFGILFVAARRHHPVLDQRGRMFIGQIGGLIVINLVIGFALAGVIDNYAHLGGLAAGAWLGFIIPPARVATLKTMWQRPAGSTSMVELGARIAGILALAAVLIAGYAIGASTWP